MKLLKFIPIVSLTVITTYTWYLLLQPKYSPTIWHISGLTLLILNLFLLKYSTEKGHFFTFLLLLIGTFGFSNFTLLIIESSYFIRISNLKISSPSINPYILPILIVYCFVNYDVLKLCFERLRVYTIKK